MSVARPLAVLVTGAPGSGKTTLATVLAQELRLPHISKDLLVAGVWRTRHRAAAIGVEGIEIHYRLMETYLCLGVSFVTDQTFLPTLSEEEVLRRLAPLGRLVQVHCRATNPAARWEARMRADPLCGPGRLDDLRPRAFDYQELLASPLDFGSPIIEVNTDDGYRPPLRDVVAEINRLHPPPHVHDLDR